MLDNVKVRSPYGRLRIPSGSEPVLLRGKVRFEDRTQHEHDGCLDHAVLHRRDAQRPLAAIAFWNPHTQKWLRHIALAPQLLLQRFQPPIRTCGLDPIEVGPVHPWCAGIGPAAPIGFQEHVFSADLVPQAIESLVRFGLGFRLARFEGQVYYRRQWDYGKGACSRRCDCGHSRAYRQRPRCIGWYGR